MRSRSHPGHRGTRRLAAAATVTAVALGASALAAPAAQAAPTQVQILATNDFHGRIAANGTEAGAAKLAGVVQSLRATTPNTVFAAAGDLIGASTFESFIQSDKPTIDALNAAGLEVSAVGNHELDQGYDDLINRVMAPYDAETNPYGGAEWQYIAANLKVRATGDDAVPATWIKEFGDVQVGFVGAVTEELPALVSPSGIADIEVRSIVDSVNTEAAELVGAGADLVVMLVHEGAPTTDCTQAVAAGTAWGEIVGGVSADVDAIVSGHTHLAYNCEYPVQQWASESRPVTTRPVVSAGQYGTNLNQLLFTVDGATGVVSAKSQSVVAIAAQPAAPDPAVATLVANAIAQADVLGAEPLGELAGGFSRAKLANGTTENRGGESTLGNLVAEVQQWATEAPESGGAQIAFMNPGGLRQDMLGTDPGNGAYPRTLTYKQAAVVQPFANTLVNLQLTGAQIKTVLEQQWQRDAYNALPTRPYLRLGASQGFEYTYTQAQVTETQRDNPATVENEEGRTYQAPRGTVTGMWLNGQPIDPAATYSVTVNSFLSSGGDNFREFANGTDRRDTGKIDLAAMVDYLGQFAPAGSPLAVDYSQRAVEVTPGTGSPASYGPRSTVTLNVRSWAMTAPGDTRDAQITASWNGTTLGSFPVDNTVGTAIYDDYGTATVTVTLPPNVRPGAGELTLTGATTGTSVSVPVAIGERSTLSLRTKQDGRGGDVSATVTVRTKGAGTGTVSLYEGTQLLGTAEVVDGVAAFDLSSLSAGRHRVTAQYSGDATTLPSDVSGSVRVR